MFPKCRLNFQTYTYSFLKEDSTDEYILFSLFSMRTHNKSRVYFITDRILKMRKYCIQFPNLVSDFFFSVSVKLCYADAESSLDKEEIP